MLLGCVHVCQLKEHAHMQYMYMYLYMYLVIHVTCTHNF